MTARRPLLVSIGRGWEFREEINMSMRLRTIGLFLSLVFLLAPGLLRAQSMNASISGTVTDPSGAAVPSAELTLTALGTRAVAKFTTSPDGLFRFPNLQEGAYELQASAKGFRDFLQKGIAVNINESVRVDVKLALGTAVQTIEVMASASPLNFETAEVKQAITPKTLEELPLIVGGNLRSAVAFVTLMPGVSTGGGNLPFDARINGGVQLGDEAVIDGVSMQDGANSQSGIAEGISDHPWSPEAISEVSVLTSNYEPQYGATTSSVITAVTKSGTNKFHGTLYEFMRNTALNARQFGVVNKTDSTGKEIPGTARPKDLEHDFGGNIGGPLKIPWLAWTGRKKTYFFVNYEGFRIRGGAVTPILSIPSLKERQGDFTDWVDANGNLIPVYDPATTRPNLNFNPNQPEGPNNLPYLRDQFMGCDGKTPNVICPSDTRLQNSLAKQWFQFLPNPTFTGPLNNYVVPIPISNTVNGDGTLIDVRVDQYVGEKDHFFGTVHYHGSFVPTVSQLPPQLASEEPYEVNYTFLDRLNWDHTLSPRLLNHFAFGYNDIWSEVHCLDEAYAKQLPQIPGVPSHDFPPVIYPQDFTGFGCSDKFKDGRPAYIANDQLTWVRGKHTFKFGGEYRALGINNTERYNTSGTFGFSRLNTGLIGITSGNSIASFLLEQVDSANAIFYTVDANYPRTKYWSTYFGDTWKATPKLSINYGLRWDLSPPTEEKYNNLSFFDPVGPNPGAGNRPGRLTFAGTKWGAASFGRRTPETTWHRAFAPRLGIAYSLTPKTVIRTGYGIFFQQAYYPGWNGGVSTDGFNANPSFSSSLGGLQAAFILSQGFPQNFSRPPFIDPSADNGQGSIHYRPFDGNRLSYTQQWNLTFEHQFTSDFYVSTAYVANKGTRLPSRVAPLNALDPKYLSMGQRIYDQFQSGQTSLDGVPIPYAGWVDQMTGCPPSVGQALLPYPQYCSGLYGQNENAGNSTYHSFQLKAEKRFSHGLSMLTSYTISKLISDSDSTQADALFWSGLAGAISPFERRRNKALAPDDVPQTLSATFIYQLPFGAGQRFLNKGGWVDKLVGGWQASTIFRAQSGIPFFFRSGTCNVPGAFQAGCIPGILPGANPFGQQKGSFNPALPLLNVNAFESGNNFNFYFGQGPRVSNLRGFGYHNEDFGLIKNTKLTERFSIQFRAEFFNVWNWHILSVANGGNYSYSAFNSDVSSPSFGMWNGSVSTPRNIQLGMKILF